MSYTERIRASARRVARHFQGGSGSLVDRDPGSLNTGTLVPGGGSSTTYTVSDCMTLSASDLYARTGVTAAGDLIAIVPRDPAAWDPSQATPEENWQVTIGGEVGTVRKVQTKVPVWILECSQQ